MISLILCVNSAPAVSAALQQRVYLVYVCLVYITCTPDKGKACLACSFSLLLEGITRQSEGSQLDATVMVKSATAMWITLITG